MERQRQAEMRKQFDSITKAALVNNIKVKQSDVSMKNAMRIFKESRRRSGNLTGFLSNSMDLDLLPIDSTWSQSRPKSANYQNEFVCLNNSTKQNQRKFSFSSILVFR